MAAPHIHRKSQAVDVDWDIAEEEEYYVTRPHTSVRRYKQPVQRDTIDDDCISEPAAVVPRRRANSPAPAVPGTPLVKMRPTAQRSHKRLSWLTLLLGMLLMLGLFLGLRAFTSWWQVRQDDATYGRPRTYQVDAVVGHQDGANHPSHFIFLNLDRHVVIIEFPGGDATHALVYTGPTLFGDGSDLLPITGEFKDVNGDGRPDMLVHIQDQTLVFINDGTKFRPLQPGEHITP
ncbi:MAG: hypothetical protein ACRDHZ_02175 [Ktedonobacteraceae bacterium]